MSHLVNLYWQKERLNEKNVPFRQINNFCLEHFFIEVSVYSRKRKLCANVWCFGIILSAFPKSSCNNWWARFPRYQKPCRCKKLTFRKTRNWRYVFYEIWKYAFWLYKEKKYKTVTKVLINCVRCSETYHRRNKFEKEL